MPKAALGSNVRRPKFGFEEDNLSTLALANALRRQGPPPLIYQPHARGPSLELERRSPGIERTLPGSCSCMGTPKQGGPTVNLAAHREPRSPDCHTRGVAIQKIVDPPWLERRGRSATSRSRVRGRCFFAAFRCNPLKRLNWIATFSHLFRIFSAFSRVFSACENAKRRDFPRRRASGLGQRLAEGAGRADIAGERAGAGARRRIATATKTTPAAAT